MSDFNPLVLIGTGSSFAFSALFYSLYKEKQKELRKLRAVPLFKPDEHLLKLLKAAPLQRLQYVAVEGVVVPDGEPLASQFVQRCFGVVQKVVVKEHWKYWNPASQTWNSRTHNRKETNNAVPFSLVQPGVYLSDVRVKVQSPQEASGHYLESVHRRSRAAEESLLNVVLQGVSGERPEKLEESEELLRVGTAVTGFGEVVLEHGDSVRLRAPRDGREYVLVASDHRSLVERHEATASMWKSLAAVSGVLGTCLLAGLLRGSAGGKRHGGSE